MAAKKQQKLETGVENQEVVLLEKANTSLKEENTLLKAEIEELKKEVSKLKNDVRQYRKKIGSMESGN